MTAQPCLDTACMDFGETTNDCPPHHYKPPNGPFRENKVFVLSRKCDTCIFRPGNLMHLQEGKRDQMVKECLAENTVIPCHSTLDGPRSVCRGFFDLHQGDVMPLRMAMAFGILAYDDPPAKDTEE